MRTLSTSYARRFGALAFFGAVAALTACSGIGSVDLDEAGVASDSGAASDGGASPGDSAVSDGSRGGGDGGGSDGASDSGVGGDAGTECTGTNQCDDTHKCSDGAHCCAPLPGLGGCGFCSTGVCPG
ncbi:MAG: hypothetical protein ACRELY_05870 [Polyangiaceae bacterium]